MINLAIIDELGRGRIGMFDAPCPMCGPERRAPVNRRRPVLRIWRTEPSFATWCCARCGERGFARDTGCSSSRPDPEAIARARAEAAELDQATSAERLSKAVWLWKSRAPLAGSIGEAYLREARSYTGSLPATLGFLPARGDHGPAMIAAFGIPTEPEPGMVHIADDAVRGVHITRLASDGSGKAGSERDKIMLGASNGLPIVLAAPNDLFGLGIAEGIEDALSLHATTGLGAWAAGSASRMPALAGAVPNYIEAATLAVDDDEAGRRHARELGERLRARGIREVRLALAGAFRGAAS